MTGGWPGIGRLAIRHALLAALLGVVLGAVFTLLQLGDDYRRSEEAERREIQQMMTVMREPAAQACYNLNPQAALVVVQGALTYMPVLQASLVSDFGDLLAQASNDPARVHADAWWARFIEPTLTHSLPLVAGPERRRVGELKVVTAQAPRVERFLQGAWRDAGLNLLRSVTVAMALGVLSYLTLTRPLTAIARRIGHGPAASPGAGPMAEARRADEIGQIASAFERYEREAGERARSLEASARALAASEVRYRRIVETAGEGVWQLDAQGRTTLANEAMARMLGSTADGLLGRSLFEFLAVADHPAGQALLRHRPGAQDGERHAIRLQRADGHAVWAEVSTCAMADADGQPAGTLAMVTNATERRRRDEELRATNARLMTTVEDLERHKSDMARITELNELLQSARTEREAYDVIRAAAARLFADSPGGFAVAGPGEDMQVVGAWSEPACLPERYPRSACWAIRRGARHLRARPHDMRCSHWLPQRDGAMLCLPLSVEADLIGVLHLQGSDEATAIGEAVLQRAEVFGEVVKLGLSNLRLRDSLREQALRDVLTGLPNRRLFDETLPRELSRCLREGQPLSLAVVDVDHFKHFNDTYGHDAGDRVLRAVAQVLADSIRASDMACRYGGDEFMCLLPGLGAADAKARFEQALARMAERAGASGLPGEAITFTVGLATAPDGGGDMASLVRAADAALYGAKAQGRNRVVAASPTQEPLRRVVARLG